MLFDIVAAQHLYGANTGYDSGINLYQLTGRKVIWDSGGTDTVDAAGSLGPMSIDLRAGGFSRDSVSSSRRAQTSQSPMT